MTVKNYAAALLFNTSSSICFGYLLEHMVYEEIKLNTAFADIIILFENLFENSLQRQIHFNDTNALVVTRVLCI